MVGPAPPRVSDRLERQVQIVDDVVDGVGNGVHPVLERVPGVVFDLLDGVPGSMEHIVGVARDPLKGVLDLAVLPGCRVTGHTGRITDTVADGREVAPDGLERPARRFRDS